MATSVAHADRTCETPQQHTPAISSPVVTSAPQKSPDSSTHFRNSLSDDTQSIKRRRVDESDDDVAKRTEYVTETPPGDIPQNLTQDVDKRPSVSLTSREKALPEHGAGRSGHLDILQRVFPYQKRSVLELVLQGCGGDIVKAIEHFLSAQDKLVAQQKILMRHQGITQQPHDPFVNPQMPHLNPFLLPHPQQRAFFAGMNPSFPADFETRLKNFEESSENSKQAFGATAQTLHSAFLGNRHQFLSPITTVAKSREQHKELDKSSEKISEITGTVSTNQKALTSQKSADSSLTLSHLHPGSMSHPSNPFSHSFGSHLFLPPFRPWALPLAVTTQPFCNLRTPEGQTADALTKKNEVP